MPEHWLFVRGLGSKPLPRRVDEAAISAQHSTKRPSVQRGDLGVLYASVWQAIFGIVEVVGEPEQDPTRSRWSWRFPIRPAVVVTDLDVAPPVEAAGVFPQSIWRHSHIRLTDQQFASARELIEAAA
jgi:EVE domain